MWTLLQISWQVRQWKNYGNRPTSDEVIVKNKKVRVFLRHSVVSLAYMIRSSNYMHMQPTYITRPPLHCIATRSPFRTLYRCYLIQHFYAATSAFSKNSLRRSRCSSMCFTKRYSVWQINIIEVIVYAWCVSGWPAFLRCCSVWCNVRVDLLHLCERRVSNCNTT